MLKPKEEAQSIKRIETINHNNIKKIVTCDDLIEVCIDIIENMDINIADFIIKNKVYGYSKKMEFNKSLESIVYFKENLIKKRKITNDLESINDYIINYNKENIISDIIILTGVYFMYIGNFTKGLSYTEYASLIGEKDEYLITNIESLNEFIFKYNLSVDITKLGNYKEACETLQNYYNKLLRLDRGDQLLIIIYEYLNKNSKSEKILDSISNICSNALFHYEIKNKGIFEKHKTHFVLGVSILVVTIVGIKYFPNIKFDTSKNKKTETNQVAQVVNKPSAPKEEPKKDEPKEILKEDKKEVKPLDIKTLENMINNLEEKNIGIIEEQFSLVNLGNSKNTIKQYETLKKQFSIKKQKLYYDLGREEYKKGNIDSSINSLTLAYNEKTGEYLEPHVIYNLASALNKKSPEKAIPYYEEYIKKYSKEDNTYIEEAIYNIANIYWNLNDKKQAKKYANKLRDNYSNSMYNNKKIDEILY